MTANDDRVCEWYESGHILGIDELIEKFDRESSGVSLEGGYMDTFSGAIHLSDWKSEFKTWVTKLMEAIEYIAVEVEELPDDEYALYLEQGDTYTGLEQCAKCEGKGKMVVDGFIPPDCKQLVTCPYCDGKGFLVVNKV